MASKDTVDGRFRPAPKAGLALTGCLVLAGAFGDALRAERLFPHGAVGHSGPLAFKSELVLSSNYRVGKFLSAVTGRVNFFAPDGRPFPIQVTGLVVLQGSGSPVMVQRRPLSEFEFRLLGPTRYILESEGPISAFWTSVQEDQDGKLTASLRFVLIDSGIEVSFADVPSSERRNSHGFVVSAAVKPGQTRLTGIAICNPSGQTSRYAAAALDGQGDQAAIAEFSLGPNQQRAVFVNELFVDSQGQPLLSADFNGFVQIVSQRDSASAALLETIEGSTIAISAARADGQSEAPIPFLAARTQDFLVLGESGDGLAADRQRGFLNRGKVTLSNGQTALEGSISPDGNILMGPVDSGEWQLKVEAPGYLPFQQPVDFPSPPLRLDLISLARINPAWFEETLGPLCCPDLRGRIFKPARQFTFVFDAGSFDRIHDDPIRRKNIQKVRDAFRQWVFFELPQIGLEVEDGKGNRVRFGGREQYVEAFFEDPPAQVVEDTIIISADPLLDTPLGGGTAASEETFEVLGSVLRFHPRNVSSPYCDPSTDGGAFDPKIPCDVPRLVSAFFWNAVFLRQFNGVDLDLEQRALTGLPNETGILSSVLTQATANPLSFSSSGLDVNYWRVLARRPAGTRITSQGEFLPKEDLQSRSPNALSDRIIFVPLRNLFTVDNPKRFHQPP